MSTIPLRACRVCGAEKSSADYYFTDVAHTKLATICKVCFIRRVDEARRKREQISRDQWASAAWERKRAQREAAGTQECVTCHVDQPLAAYYLADKRTGRMASECKTCKIARSKAYGSAHPGYVAGLSRVYRARHKADPIYHARSLAIWRQSYVRNADQKRAYTRAWRAAHPLAMRLQRHIRRARARAADGHYSARDWERIKAEQGYRCPACLRQEPEITLTADHVVPLARGGTNWPANIQGLCGPCNNRKRCRTIDYRPRGI